MRARSAHARRLLLACAQCVLAPCLPSMAQTPGDPPTLYVSPDGQDAWSGALPQPDGAGTDGPLATVHAARDTIRAMREDGRLAAGARARVVLRGGTYWLTEPLVLEPRDSHVDYVAYPGEHPVLSGGTLVGGLTREADGTWATTLPGVADGSWYPRQLFVDGRRATRAKSPNEGFYFVRDTFPPPEPPGQEPDESRTAFRFEPGDIRPWVDLEDAEVVVFHSWETSRHHIASLDEDAQVVRFTGPAHWHFGYFGPEQRFYVENIAEALDTPGEWHLDRRTGRLRILPEHDQDLSAAEVIAARLPLLVALTGDAELGLVVHGVRFDGLCFAHQDWTLPPGGHSDAQAAFSVPAAVMLDGAANCRFDGCEVAHVGGYGLWLRRGCHGNTITRGSFHDLGAGGIRIGEALPAAADAAESRANTVENNHIHDGGHVYAAGVGIWVAQSSHNLISHNDVHDLNYSGMSIGWNWGDEPNRTRANTIEFNHVHHVMGSMLNDGGAIYTLGVSPGSVIRGNLLHDVWPYSNLGWGIYLDATTAGYTVSHNVVYNTYSGGVMYNNGGHDNVIDNNVFAFSAAEALWPCFEPRPCDFRRNIVYLSQGELLVPFAEHWLRDRIAAGESLGVWDENVYFRTGARPLKFLGRDFADWQALGLDARSQIADPEFLDVAAYDFRLAPTSPAIALGIESIDVSSVGLYGDPEWVRQPSLTPHEPVELSRIGGRARPQSIGDGFETRPPGSRPSRATVSGERHGASIRIAAEVAASGDQSLAIRDAAGLELRWEPHFYYQLDLTEGMARQSFDLWLGAGGELFTEWRDDTAYPGCVGPSVAVNSAGQVSAGGTVLTAIPLGQWVHFDIECALGNDPPSPFVLTVTVPGDDGPRRFTDLPVPGADFHALRWVGFVSTADADTTSYIDNVEVDAVPAP
ncbi:MAG TPA: right-handed parallel beta-helix repeat-containing protein [Armatimonadota bacterium]|nr:right-handed parallel beta-helix repeat-containing protein [Armatimonadota bacterium]